MYRILHEDNKSKIFLRDDDLSVYVKGKNIYNHIGHINKETLSIETVRNPKKHLFHKYNGYGFNSFVLTNAKHMRYIEIKIESCIYRVPISIWLSHGVQTTEESFEKQYILSKLIIEEYAI